MNLPKFNAEASLGKSTRNYKGKALYSTFSLSQEGLFRGVVPSQLETMETPNGEDQVDLIGVMGEEDLMYAMEEEAGADDLTYTVEEGAEEADLMGAMGEEDALMEPIGDEVELEEAFDNNGSDA